MKKIRILFLSVLTLAIVLIGINYSGVDAASYDEGSLSSGQTKSGTYGTYSASFDENEGMTKAVWKNGGGGTVYLKMSTRVEVSKSGGQLQPGGNPTAIYDQGRAVQHHKYIGIPAY